MFKKIPGLITLSVALVAIGISVVELFPRTGHLGTEPDATQQLLNTIVAAVIATIVILIFRAARGKVSLKLPVPGLGESVQFSATQTQASLWCIVYIVVKLF